MADRPRPYGLIALAGALFLAAPALADTVRVATFNASLSRDTAGALLQDIEDRDAQVLAAAEVILAVAPDVLLLNEIDHDPQSRSLDAFIALLAERGLVYEHSFTAPVNTGELTGLDLDGDGSTTGPNDAYGWGRWPGHFGMAVLSRYPLGEARSFRLLRWAEFEGNLMPEEVQEPARSVLRLSSKSHWDVPVELPGGPVHLLASHPTPPVFDGPEDTNGRRNHDEVMFWVRYLDGTPFTDDAGVTAALGDAPVIVAGDLNADPFDGDARREALAALLAHPRLQDPGQESAGAIAAAEMQGGLNAAHAGPAAQDTSDWNDERGPGNLRVDYVLPSADLEVSGSGVWWPAPDKPGAEHVGFGEAISSDHRLVWVDIEVD
ncbi:endonuclease/exonuclease/phosphatase family protein [Pontivivens ytuae]|uniref:Endonuclease/exonuclease/phosphatase family protein n=1 Tax=Pontivivens ytuae TaxID=2789856 RepID=A0A7S9LUM7_9RHOB|nr:endonuclease/exonuclease/phosphatase family protein [Pontivivens ytuae]QPH55569.1 endonuclease/exonuclease/phosphatase family protein [Pontivivens ytuae]